MTFCDTREWKRRWKIVTFLLANDELKMKWKWTVFCVWNETKRKKRFFVTDETLFAKWKNRWKIVKLFENEK